MYSEEAVQVTVLNEFYQMKNQSPVPSYEVLIYICCLVSWFSLYMFIGIISWTDMEIYISTVQILGRPYETKG